MLTTDVLANWLALLVMGAVWWLEPCGKTLSVWWYRQFPGSRKSLERFQKLLVQRGHVLIRLHNLREDLDRIENVRERITLGKI